MYMDSGQAYRSTEMGPVKSYQNSFRAEKSVLFNKITKTKFDNSLRAWWSRGTTWISIWTQYYAKDIISTGMCLAKSYYNSFRYNGTMYNLDPYNYVDPVP